MLESYRLLDKELTERGVPRPVVILTENLSSRKDEAVLNFCQEVGIRLFRAPRHQRISSGIVLPPPYLSLPLYLCSVAFSNCRSYDAGPGPDQQEVPRGLHKG